MLTLKQEHSEHKYSSTPLDWLTMETNIAYWLHSSTNVRARPHTHTFCTYTVAQFCHWLFVSQAQIHLIGNPVSWAMANLSLLAYQLLAFVYLLRRRRGFKDLPDGTCMHTHTNIQQNHLESDLLNVITMMINNRGVCVCARVHVYAAVWFQFVCLGCVCVGGWAVNFVPYFLMEKTLFLYHYLPALCYLYVLSPALLEHIHTHLLRYTQSFL